MVNRLDEWKPLVSFLGKALGKNYEVFLYDLTQKEHPIVAIENGALSGRKVGSLMKNVIIKMLDTEREGEESDELIRHNAISRDGKQFKSSTLLIRNDQGQPIGALCINFNVDPLIGLVDYLNSISESFSEIKPIDRESVIFAGEVFSETRAASLDKIYNHTLEQLEADGHLDRAIPRHRQRIVDQFCRDGGFRQKGAASFLSRKLDISEPTVYRYLAKSKEKLKKEKE